MHTSNVEIGSWQSKQYVKKTVEWFPLIPIIIIFLATYQGTEVHKGNEGAHILKMKQFYSQKV